MNKSIKYKLSKETQVHERSASPPRVNILGVGISAINLQTAVKIIDDWISHRDPHYVCVTPVHGVTDSQKDPSFRRILNNSGLTTPDGMPIVWIMKWKGHKNVGRVYGPDLLLALCERSQASGYRHYFYGGAKGVPELLATRLRERFPCIEIVGTYSPPFRPLTIDEDTKVINMINKSNPDIVWVGMSTPIQDHWMADHIGKLSAPVIIGIGAAFDFHSGRKKQAPRWMQRSGVEWLFRLLTEPRRLWKRYLINNPLFIYLLILQILGLKEYSLSSNNDL